MEQLIPASLLEQYGIQSRTPIAGILPPERATENLLEVPETDEGLRAALIAAGVKPMICQEKGKKENKELAENKKRLQKLVDKTGRKLIFIPDPTKPVKKGSAK